VSDAEPIIPPHIALPTETVVVDSKNDVPLMRFDGLLPLPIGTRINIDNGVTDKTVPIDTTRFPNGRADAVVVSARVWGTQGNEPPLLVLYVNVTEVGNEGGWMIDR
jgi:hypothetical protein